MKQTISVCFGRWNFFLKIGIILILRRLVLSKQLMNRGWYSIICFCHYFQRQMLDISETVKVKLSNEHLFFFKLTMELQLSEYIISQTFLVNHIIDALSLEIHVQRRELQWIYFASFLYDKLVLSHQLLPDIGKSYIGLMLIRNQHCQRLLHILQLSGLLMPQLKTLPVISRSFKGHRLGMPSPYSVYFCWQFHQRYQSRYVINMNWSFLMVMERSEHYLLESNCVHFCCRINIQK